jgi:peptidoglycan-associated lipoprotein
MGTPLFLAVALAVTTMACAHEQPKRAEPTPAPTVSAPPVSAVAQPSSQKTCSADLDCQPNQFCIRSACVDITPNLAECSAGVSRVHFDFNMAEIHPNEVPKIERMGRCLMTLHRLHVTVEGNADERGTDEYNLALGDKRATAVEDYLERLGVPQDQLRRVTYGKEHPLCTQHNEDCWAKNRRAAMRTKH